MNSFIAIFQGFFDSLGTPGSGKLLASSIIINIIIIFVLLLYCFCYFIIIQKCIIKIK